MNCQPQISINLKIIVTDNVVKNRKVHIDNRNGNISVVCNTSINAILQKYRHYKTF